MQQHKLCMLATLKKNRPALIMLGYILFLLITGMVWPSEITLLQGLGRIIRAPGVLVTDYMALVGPGPTLVNAALVGLIGLAMVYFSGAAVSGPTVAAIFTMMGFALSGKSVFNILPIIAGVMLMSFYKKERFCQFVILAMFGTTLAPLVSHICFSLQLAPVWGLLIGIVAGALLPELATHFLGVHAGFNLYNIGFAAGFLGTLITSQLRAFGRATDMIMIWSVEYTASLTVLLLCYFISLIILGTIIEPGAWRKLPQIFRQSGLLVSDFIVNTLWQASFSAPKSKSGIPRIQGQF